jgi:hypothetical protein
MGSVGRSLGGRQATFRRGWKSVGGGADGAAEKSNGESRDISGFGCGWMCVGAESVFVWVGVRSGLGTKGYLELCTFARYSSLFMEWGLK